MTTYLWTIEQMQCAPQQDGRTDVVLNLAWRCTGTEGVHSASVYSTCALPAPSGSDFTPYAQLTQDQVLGWLWAHGVDKESAQASIDTQIANQINPPIVTPRLPWAA